MVGAAAALVAVSAAMPAAATVPALALAAAGGAAGGVFPDLDVKSSAHPLRDRAARVAAATMLAGAVALDAARGGTLLRAAAARGMAPVAIGVVALAGLLCAARLSAHRGLSHSLAALVALAAATWLACPPLAAPVAVGMASHLALDLLGHRPVRLLWPARGGVCLGICKTGGIVDTCCCAAGVAAAARVVLLRL